ncbi:MFS transporter [Pelagibius sp. Alg239-R121]|uniref:MFS transporter n=1 Tax=Pelagibius sp. Alg239-R121 TaxID=2993448 RepID=UPI0024A62256|nr:MFS transporter [Pelagibius sp. Alg239-R121]
MSTETTSPRNRWIQPEILLMLMAASVPLSFATWQTLLNNFAIESAAFTGAEMGMLQSIREIPGFLAFAVVLVLLLLQEQTLAVLALLLLGIGTAVTGFFPSVLGLYATTVIMSLGYHYFETVQTSLALQWIDKKRTAEVLAKILAVGSLASIVTFALIWLAFDFAGLSYQLVYVLGGGLTVVVALACWRMFPHYPEKVRQHKKMLLRRRYWLYYLLTFMSGARRQIFIVFAGFLMVEKFGYEVSEIAVLFFINAGINVVLAPRIGRLIGKIGERRSLLFEYVGLIIVFVSYAFVENATVAAGLYVIDHMFFALAIAIKTYFQKIADPADIAATAGVGFTINHIAAVVIPVVFGLLWLSSPALVFLAGAAMAAVSLVLAFGVPLHPEPGNETVFGKSAAASVPAE